MGRSIQLAEHPVAFVMDRRRGRPRRTAGAPLVFFFTVARETINVERKKGVAASARCWLVRPPHEPVVLDVCEAVRPLEPRIRVNQPPAVHVVLIAQV